MNQKVIEKLKQKDQIFSFESDPLLASLVCCLGLQFEIGKPEWDRLSLGLGIELSHFSSNPWKSEIIIHDGQIGIKMWIPKISEFIPRHEDFSLIFHPHSLNTNQKLEKVIIFPAQVAQHYKKRGLELVIVKDWALNSFLAPDSDSTVHYLNTNKWEIERNSAGVQTQLMANRQVAFFGTHDLTDHLLGGHEFGFTSYQILYESLNRYYQSYLNEHRTPMKVELLVSYMLGVLLDDMAQPIWYHSKNHKNAAEWTFRLLKNVAQAHQDIIRLELPQSFHQLMKILRDKIKPVTTHQLQTQLSLMSLELSLLTCDTALSIDAGGNIDITPSRTNQFKGFMSNKAPSPFS